MEDFLFVIDLIFFVLDCNFNRHVKSSTNGKSPNDFNRWIAKVGVGIVNQLSLLKSFILSEDFHQTVRHNTTATLSSFPIFIPNLLSPSLNLLKGHTITAQHFCTNTKQSLTHVDSSGKASMVDVSDKPITTREAQACAKIYVGPRVAQLIHSNNVKKGDVLSIARLAGILGAKKTSELIPLCHNIPISSIKVEASLELESHSVNLSSKVRCSGNTGVEMEALTAVSVAALTVYDMCKAVTHDMIITDIKLMSKSGGQRGDFQRKQN